MKLNVTPDLIWGAFEPKIDFRRLNLSEDDLHLNAIGKYNAGMFIVLNPIGKIESLTLNFTAHAQNVPAIGHAEVNKWMLRISVLDGNIWRNTDAMSLFELANSKAIINDKDRTFSIVYNLKKYTKIKEIQISFPSVGFIKNLSLDSNVSLVPKKPSKLNTIFLGSSVGTFNFVNSQLCLPSYVYRNYGLNVCTAAIPRSHTFNCPKFMQQLLNSDEYKSIDKILVDLENLSINNINDFQQYIQKIDCFIFKPSAVHHDVDMIITQTNIKNVFEANADMCCDWGHPNAYGIVSYVNWLRENGKLVEK